MAFPYVKIGPWTNGIAPFLSAANATLLDDGIYNAQFPPTCKVRHSANQSILDTTYTTLTFDTELWDHADFPMHAAGNPTRLTAPVAGKYLVSGSAEFASNATGLREVVLYFNGTTIHTRVQIAALSGAVTVLNITDQLSLAAADYVELRVRQTSGGALNVVTSGVHSPILSAVRVA